MPKYYGCPCEGCGKPLTLQDDIVVCPDCGAPIKNLGAKFCEYCGSAVEVINSRVWSLEHIKEDR